jgi:hypothetical protein
MKFFLGLNHKNIMLLHKSHKYCNIKIMEVLLHSEIENSGTPTGVVSYMRQKSCIGSDCISLILKLTAFLLHTHSRTLPE